ncbi:cation-transporting atpase 4 [Pyrenophora seminiperda CCB06]|uniref:Cation-transporting atpase 4 n=1 Tax=Pyrenophora seminiperda CCB06 TaxID=1302712 RepID=A0A3M7MHD2_9PLEO|nr:cation-transporting atpase 4 [Pyrenophora seminiperda CCB06]
MAPTSWPMALSVLIPLPFDIISTVLRFWIRYKRKAWGSDDWAMLVNVPFWTVSTIATIGMSFSGVGQLDATLSTEQYSNSLRWFYIFQEPWCFTLVAIKISIGFALIRIASGKKWIENVIYVSMFCNFVVMGGTGVYLFFQCRPVQKNWIPTTKGECNDRRIQTVLSFAVAVVSISTDWIFATLPIFLLWNVQLDWRVKGSVMAMLGLGVFASIAPIVRLKYLIGLNDNTRLLLNLGNILAWASAEMNVGMLVANLPACHPLLKYAIATFSSWTSSISGGSHNRHLSKKLDGGGGGQRISSRDLASKKSYWLELDEQPQSGNSSKRSFLSGGGGGTKSFKGQGVETRIYGEVDGTYGRSSLDDGRTTTAGTRQDRFLVNVHREIKREVDCWPRVQERV